MVAPQKEAGRGRQAARSFAVVAAAALAGAFASGHPLLGVAGSGLLVLAVAALRWPELPTLAVLALVYSNAVGVAVTQHGVPRLVGLAFPAALLFPLAHHLVVCKRPLVTGPVAGWMLAFLGVQVVGALLSANRAHSMAAVVTYVSEGFLFYILVVNVVRTDRMLRLAVWAVLLAGAFLGAVAVLQQTTRTFDNNYAGFAQVSEASFETGPETIAGQVRQPRLSGAVGEKNYHAQLMLMLVPLGFLLGRHQRSRRLMVVVVGLTVLVVAGVALTFSRGAAIGAVVMVAVAVILGYLKLRQVLLAALGAVVLLQLFPQYGMRLTSLTELASTATASSGEPGFESADRSTQSRTTEMGAAARVFLDHPVLGVGPSMFRFYYDSYTDGVGLRVKSTERVAHNLYLELAANNGILGLGAFLGAMLAMLRSLAGVRKRCLERRPELAGLATGFLLAIVSYLATGLFLSPAYARYFWLVMALAAATCVLGAEPERSESLTGLPISSST